MNYFKNFYFFCHNLICEMLVFIAILITTNDRSALSSFRTEFFTPLRNASKATVGRTSCGSNDGFPTVGVAERSFGIIVSENNFS